MLQQKSRQSLEEGSKGLSADKTHSDIQVTRTEKAMAKKKKLKEHVINREWCKGCGICVAVCPKQVLELDPKEKAVAARLDDCIACQLCEQICPDLAIEVMVRYEETSAEEGT